MWLAVRVKCLSESKHVALEVEDGDTFGDLVGRVMGLNEDDIIEVVISYFKTVYIIL